MSNNENTSPLYLAEMAVYGERRESYGLPQDNHSATAELWTTYLERRGLLNGNQLTMRDVCILNILQKVSRDANLSRPDNLTDIAGYVENAYLCAEAEKVEDGPKKMVIDGREVTVVP